MNDSTTNKTDDDIRKEIEYLLAVKDELEAIRADRAAEELEDDETPPRPHCVNTPGGEQT